MELKNIFIISTIVLIISLSLVSFLIDDNSTSTNNQTSNLTTVVNNSVIEPQVQNNITQNIITPNQTINNSINQTNICQSAEICDGLDNNCDGVIDENIICNNKLTIRLGDVFLSLKSLNGDAWIEKIGNVNGTIIELSNIPLFSIETVNSGQVNLVTPSLLEKPTFNIVNENESNIVWPKNSISDTGVQVNFKQIESKSIDLSITISGSNSRATKSVNFPVLLINSLSSNSVDTDYLENSLYGGTIQPLYASDIPQLNWRLPGELPMQYLSVYSSDRKKQFFLQTTDSTGYIKEFSVNPNKNTKQTSIFVKQFPENNLDLGKSYSSPYTVRLGVIRGNWYDAAKFYRNWAIKQPFVRAPLEKSNDISPILKNLKLFTLISPSTESTNSSTFDGYYQSLVQLKNYYSFSDWELMSVWYRWHNNSFDNNLPDHLPPRAGLTGALASAINNHIAVIPYTFNGVWAINSQSYIQNNIDSLVTKDENNQVQNMNLGLQTQPHAQLDTSLSTSRDLIKNNILQIINLGFSGLYWDAFAGIKLPLDYSINHNHARGGGNYLTQGKIELFKETRDALKQINQNEFISTEFPNEYLFNSVELAYTQYISIGVVPIPMIEAVYGDRIFISDLTLSVGSETQLKDYYKLVDSFLFHNGEIASRANWQFPLINFIEINQTPEKTNVLNFLGVLINHPETRKYQRFGELLSPLPSSMLDLYDLPNFNLTSLSGVMGSVWKADNGDIGIILTNYKDNSESFTINMSSINYGLSGEYTMYENINGQRISINNLVNGDVLLTVTVQPSSLKLFELVHK